MVRGGLYEQRRFLQAGFILALGLSGAAFMVWMLIAVRESSRGMREILFGAASLVVFVLVRASSFHHVDLLLGSEIAGLRLNWVFELGAISIVSHGSWRFVRLRDQ